MTPYEAHKKLGHKTSYYSPDGFVKIEECNECPMRFLHDPNYSYPITMRPQVKNNPHYGSKYQRQGLAFLRLTGAKIHFGKPVYGQMWDDKKKGQWRDVYRVTISRPGIGRYTFKFGQSITGTAKHEPLDAYSVLAAIQKYPIGSLEDFLSEFGYEDGREARKIYRAVKNEYEKMRSLFSEEEMALMGKIS